MPRKKIPRFKTFQDARKADMVRIYIDGDEVVLFTLPLGEVLLKKLGPGTHDAGVYGIVTRVKAGDGYVQVGPVFARSTVGRIGKEYLPMFEGNQYRTGVRNAKAHLNRLEQREREKNGEG